MTLSLRSTFGLLVGASLGGAAAQGLFAPPASACECAPPTWVYSRVSVTGPEGATDHAPYWPSQVQMEAYEGYLTLTPHLLDGHGETEVLSRVTGDSE